MTEPRHEGEPRHTVLALIFISVALSACNPYLQAQSAAPPGRSARIEEVNGFWKLQYYRLELSQGVAIALTCNQGGPCEHAKSVSDDPAIAEVRPASLSVLQSSSAMVVVGKAPGRTWIHLTSNEGHRDVLVTIIPPPAAVAPQTAGP